MIVPVQTVASLLRLRENGIQFASSREPIGAGVFEAVWNYRFLTHIRYGGCTP